MVRNGKYLNCVVCKEEFYRNLSQLQKGNSRYCSHKCYWQDMKGKAPIYIDNTGHTPWNKGKEYLQIKGEKHIKWKGIAVSYRNLHRWVERELGKPTTCEFCGKANLIGKQIDWANKSREYRRELDDWIRLCKSCHFKYDGRHLQARDSKGQLL